MRLLLATLLLMSHLIVTQAQETTLVDRHSVYLKTNAVGWGWLMVNAAAEVDVSERWSIALPIYYSGWNYLQSSVRFRTLSFYPELRYWWKNTRRWYTGLHTGIAWYNYAFGGEYRRQDHQGHTPALGGGVSAGYRLPLGDSNHWTLELGLGVGVYKLYYDKFRNQPGGLQVASRKRLYTGIDQLSISIAYRLLNFKRKKP